MKRLLILLMLFSVCGFTLRAAPVSPQKALDIAGSIFGESATKAGGRLHIIWDGEPVGAATKTAAQPAFYVVGHDGGGWVIVAGDDNSRPVLGISMDGRFSAENMPENVAWWMESLKQSVRTAPPQTAEVARMWQSYPATKSSRVEPVTQEYTSSRTVEWDQDGAANCKCPEVLGNQGLCGCLPLAMAEILTWFGYPARGTGSLSSYTYSYPYGSISIKKTIQGYDLDTDYQWGDLQAISSGSDFASLDPTSAIGQNLGQLVYDCGVMLQAQYTWYYTGASEYFVTQAFGEHMGYAKSAHLKKKDDYPADIWTEMLRKEVERHPFLYTGISRSDGRDAGHAYVLDGYATYNNQDIVFHFNFGWGGNNNGYYYADGQNAGGYNYEYDQGAIFGFEKDEGGSTTYDDWDLKLYAGGIYHGLTPSVTPVPGEDFNLNFYGVVNYGPHDFDGQFKVVLEHRDGTQTPLGGAFTVPEVLTIGVPRHYSAPISAIPSWGLGDRLVVYYTLNSDGVRWAPLVATASNGNVVEEYPLTPTPFIAKESLYSTGQYFELKVRNYAQPYASASWTIIAPDGSTSVLAQSDQRVQLSQAGKYRIEVVLDSAEPKLVTTLIVQ